MIIDNKILLNLQLSAHLNGKVNLYNFQTLKWKYEGSINDSRFNSFVRWLQGSEFDISILGISKTLFTQ